ncbi:MAG: hypothetical protein AAF378_23540 [Cyanobacteria bacterium P01_A01_bin.84]
MSQKETEILNEKGQRTGRRVDGKFKTEDGGCRVEMSYYKSDALKLFSRTRGYEEYLRRFKYLKSQQAINKARQNKVESWKVPANQTLTIKNETFSTEEMQESLNAYKSEESARELTKLVSKVFSDTSKGKNSPAYTGELGFSPPVEGVNSKEEPLVVYGIRLYVENLQTNKVYTKMPKKLVKKIHRVSYKAHIIEGDFIEREVSFRNLPLDVLEKMKEFFK